MKADDCVMDDRGASLRLVKDDVIARLADPNRL